MSGCIGSGQFGVVERGVWSSPAGPKNVAIKSLREESSDEDRVRLFQEAAINGQFHHPSIIILHGVVTVGKKVNKECMSVNVLIVWFTFPANDCAGANGGRRHESLPSKASIEVLFMY